MRALSDALPTGHRAMANPTLQLRFGCGRATPPVSHSHNWPSGRMQNVLFKIGQKSYFLPIKTPKLILTIEWYYRSLYCRSNAMIFLNGQFEGDIIFCHLKWARQGLQHVRDCYLTRIPFCYETIKLMFPIGRHGHNPTHYGNCFPNVNYPREYV